MSKEIEKLLETGGLSDRDLDRIQQLINEKRSTNDELSDVDDNVRRHKKRFTMDTINKDLSLNLDASLSLEPSKTVAPVTEAAEEVDIGAQIERVEECAPKLDAVKSVEDNMKLEEEQVDDIYEKRESSSSSKNLPRQEPETTHNKTKHQLIIDDQPGRSNSLRNEYQQQPETTRKKTKQQSGNILDKLISLQCPFTWKPELDLRNVNETETESEPMDDASGFSFFRFTKYLVSCYECACRGKNDESLKYVDSIRQMLSCDTVTRSISYELFDPALKHILFGCMIYLNVSENNMEDAMDLLQKIVPYEKMDVANKSSIWAVRSSVEAEGGYNGLRNAVEYITKAIEFKKEGYWFFLKGKYLGRIRRKEDSFALPSFDEINNLQLSIQRRYDFIPKAYLAEVFCELGLNTLRKLEGQNDGKTADENVVRVQEKCVQFFKRSLNLLKECLDSNPSSSEVLFRCGKGLMKLPPPYQDLKLAKQCLEKGLRITPTSSFGNHAMAKYFGKFSNNFEKENELLQTCIRQNVFGAEIDSMRYQHMNEREYDLIKDLERLLNKYSETPRQTRLISEIIACYLFEKNDLLKAIEYMRRLLNVDENSDHIHNFRSSFLLIKEPFSLLDVLVDDILMQLNGGKNVPVKLRETCEEFLLDVESMNVSLSLCGPPRNLRTKILRQIQQNRAPRRGIRSDRNGNKERTSRERSNRQPVNRIPQDSAPNRETLGVSGYGYPNKTFKPGVKNKNWKCSENVTTSKPHEDFNFARPRFGYGNGRNAQSTSEGGGGRYEYRRRQQAILESDDSSD